MKREKTRQKYGVEETLFRYGRLRIRVKECEEEIRELYARKYSLLDSLLRPKAAEKDRVSGGKTPDPVYETVEKLVDVYEKRIKRATVELCELDGDLAVEKRLLVSLNLPENERRFVELRYVRGLNVQDIAEEMRYSGENIYRMRRRVLQRLTMALHSQKRA